jgi:GDP-mannose 6-dehydrogenase
MQRPSNNLRINVFGLGYVGCISATCLANEGHYVTGIDIDKLKVSMINSGQSPIVEPGLDEAVNRAVESGNLRARTNESSHFGVADISVICVGTPSNENGSLNLNSVKRACQQIGMYLRKIDGYHVVNVRSTVLPGTVEGIIVPIIEQKSKKRAGRDFGVCMNPEFLREGSSISDFYNPPFSIIGEQDIRSGDIVSGLYQSVNAPIIRTRIKVAEMVKYACNIFHALKVCFGNEIGNLCKRLNIDSHEVMDIFCRDGKLNISSYYLKPGFAFGGSCLPKDLRAILYKAKELDLEIPVLNSILSSNKAQIETAYNLIKRTGRKKIGFLGLSFKQGTDDLRESPMVELIETLIGKGFEVFIYDKEVSLAKIYGSNKRYIEESIPHIASLLRTSIKDVINDSQVIVIGKNDEAINRIIVKLDRSKSVIDLVRIGSFVQKRWDSYEGICW